MKCFIVLFVFICAWCLNKAAVVKSSDQDTLDKCTDGFEQFADCIKYKTVKFLDRVIQDEKPIPLSESLYLVHQPESNTNLTSNEHQQEKDLNQALARRVRMLIGTKNLQVQLHSSDEDQFQGRKKEKKGQNMMMLMGAGAMLLHGALSKLAFIAGKALIVAKIALVIASVVALKKLFTPEEHHDSTQVIYKQAEPVGHTGGGWHRSIAVPEQNQAHQMAYSGQLNSL